MESQSLTEWINSIPKEKFSLIKWFHNFFLHRKLKKAIIRWNKDLPYIKSRCAKYKKAYPTEDGREFYWHQLVWQEISMYIMLNKKIAPNEFAWLCNRRGFTLEEQNYLQSMMQYVGLMK